MAETNAWVMQGGEPSKAFAAFCAYRDLGVDRSLVKTGQKLGKKPGYVKTIEKWSKEWRWVERAAAWDAYNDQQWQEAFESRRRDVADTLASEAKKLFQMSMSSFYAKFGQNLDDEEALANISMSEVMRIFTESAKVLKLIIDRNQTAFLECPTPHEMQNYVGVTHDERMTQLERLLETARQRAKIETVQQCN